MSTKSALKFALLLSAAWIATAPGPAMAQTKGRANSQAALEARVKSLEEALAAMQAELAAARAGARAQAVDESARAAAAQAAAAASASSDKLVVLEKAQAESVAKVAAVEKRVAALPADGFKVGAATVKFGGIIKAEALYSDFQNGIVPAGNLLRDFYLPGAIPVGTAPSQGGELNSHVKQTRLMMTIAAPSEGHALGAYVEADFQSAQGTQGSQRTTNAYNFALRRAYVSYDQWLFGQDWSTFQILAALPESPDFIGVTEGTTFVRQPLARYTAKVSDTVNLQFALENPETATATPTSAALTENDVDRLPDLVARANYKTKRLDLSVGGLVRELAVDTGALDANETAWGFTAGGKIGFGESNRHDVRFMLTHGEGIGRYVGLNFAPDAVLRTVGGRLALETVPVTAGFAALRLGWTPKARSTFIYSAQQVDNLAGISAAASNDEAWSAAANLFYTPIKGLDMGVEFRHAERTLQNGQSGEMDRLHAVVKQSF